jgi:hypothetical protein
MEETLRPKNGEWFTYFYHNHAIDKIEYTTKKSWDSKEKPYQWVAHCSKEYGTPINYCPFCGVKLEVPNA